MVTGKRVYVLAVCLSIVGGVSATAQVTAMKTAWQTVVNNGMEVPGDSCETARKYNSYNAPSVNAMGLVVFRARSKGGTVCGEPAHGVYTRQMPGGAIVKILDRNTEVPDPNNLRYPPDSLTRTTFIEPPSFPRIDMWSNTLATRGNHQPVWEYMLGGTETRAGTTGIYATPGGGPLVTGTSKLGGVPGWERFAVPGAEPGTPFDVFPGSPSVSGSTIVFKGNYTESGIARTGAFYRDLQQASAGGTAPVQLLLNTKNSRIPASSAKFGSVGPPSAALGQVVFSAFDNEEQPSAGGIYLINELKPSPQLKAAVVAIGSQVPGEDKKVTFTRLGEGLSFDGRVIAFWGAWGSQMREIILYCPSEGNKQRIAYCLQQYPEGYKTTVPVNQGIFVHDIESGKTAAVAKTGKDLLDFLFWNFSGMVPGMGEGDHDGEPARWRSSAFQAVSSIGQAAGTVFKALRQDGNRGIYFGLNLPRLPSALPVFTLVDTSTDGQTVDLNAPAGSKVTEVGLERDAFRNGWLVINVSMAVSPATMAEDGGWAGIYMLSVPRPN